VQQNTHFDAYNTRAVFSSDKGRISLSAHMNILILAQAEYFWLKNASSVLLTWNYNPRNLHPKEDWIYIINCKILPEEVVSNYIL